MQRFWRLFKLPVMATAIAVLFVTIGGIVIVTNMHRAGAPRLEERAAQIGQGLAIAAMVTVSPFWVYAMYQAGKERRAELKKTNTKAKSASKKRK